ncbi:hypothetical protein AQUCO_01700101v1 [Aquilegia coerulea]|uniref:NAC domain-containing protein n=1 Tax=Aquilegia coerulea TaxID=218851 RepID=A0A2G5DL79_AQUCA|nr:hypothetical protein AQUCO_01700101v1 [Aquilegia coerulea]
MELPRGFSFKPTDAELISYYLKKKILGEAFTSLNYIRDREIYGEKAPSHPSQLFEESSSDELYFFTKIKKKYTRTTRINRTAGNGSWVIQTPRTNVYDKNDKSLVIGHKAYLIFTLKSPQQALEMDKNEQLQRQWQMYEYTLKNAPSMKEKDGKDSIWIVCMIKKGKLLDTSDDTPSPPLSSHTRTVKCKRPETAESDHQSNMPYKKRIYCRSSSLALKTTAYSEGLVQQDHNVPPRVQMDQRQCIFNNKADDLICIPVETASLTSIPQKSVATIIEEVLQQELLCAQPISQQQFSRDNNIDDWLYNSNGDDNVDDYETI